jgi:excisionase family DNA binding protein
MEGLTFDQLPDAMARVLDKLDSLEGLLTRLQHMPSDKPRGEYLTIDEAADFLHKSTATIYKLVHERKIPVLKQSGRLYFRRDELGQWLESGRRKTVAQIGESVDKSLSR